MQATSMGAAICRLFADYCRLKCSCPEFQPCHSLNGRKRESTDRPAWECARVVRVHRVRAQSLKWLQESVSESDLNEQAARDREVKRMEE